jgi:Protein of unknown function (DUF4242)
MVYVVERYVPGLFRSDLLRGLSRLERVEEQANESPAVRYLGSTIVLNDEACFCRFEGPSAAAVAEANRRAGVSFDRIVPAVTVKSERRRSMEFSTPIPAPRRSRTLVLVGVVAALAAAVTWVVLAFAVDAGNSTTEAAVTPSVVATGLTPAEQSIGSYLFGASTTLNPAQLRTIHNYRVGAAIPLTPAEQSIGSYLFGASTTLNPAQLRTIHNYRVGAAIPLTPAEQSIGSYLLGASTGLTPAQRQTIHNYQMGAAIPLTPAEQSIGSYLFGASTGLTPAQRQTIHDYRAAAGR